MSSKWGSRDDWCGEPQSRWKTGLPGVEKSWETPFHRLESSPKAEGRCRPRGGAPFARECPSSVQWPFSVSKETVSGVNSGFRFGSSRGAAWLVVGGGSLSMEWGTRFGLLEQLQVFVHLVAFLECVSPCRLGFHSGLGRHARLPPLLQWFGRNGSARHLLLRAGSSGSGRPALILNSSCCSTLVTSWTMLILCFVVRIVWCFSWS